MSMPTFDPTAFAQEGQDRSQAQKLALMQVIAEHGQVGAQAFQASQAAAAQQAQQGQADAIARTQGSAVEGNADFANGENSRMAAITNLYTQDAQHGATALASDMGRMSASNANYQDQIGQAMPLVASNIQGQFQAAQQRKDEEDFRRAQERQMAELQLQQQRESIAAARQNNTDQYADHRNADEKTMDMLKIQGAQQELAKGGQGDTAALRAAAMDRAESAAIQQLGGVGTNGYQAYQAIKDGKISMADAQKQFKTPRGASLNWDLINRLVTAHANAEYGGTDPAPYYIARP